MSLEENTIINTETETKTEKTDKEQNIYDVIIVGSGMAGITAAVYAARAELRVLILESKIAGGQITTTDVVENFPTYESISGIEIGQKLKAQIDKLGVKSEWAIVKSINKLADIFVITTEDKKIYNSKTVIFATGADPRELGIPGEREFRGRGVSYCATCDGPFYKEKEVVVIGGGDSAVKEAIYLAKIAKKVTIIHRRDQLRAEKIIGRKAAANPKIAIKWDTVVEEIVGEGNIISAVKTKNVKTDKIDTLFCDGVFIYVGTKPNIEPVKELVTLTENGYVAAGEDTKTNIPGLFAAGDVRIKELRQLVTAAADGAISATMAEQYIENNLE